MFCTIPFLFFIWDGLAEAYPFFTNTTYARRSAILTPANYIAPFDCTAYPGAIQIINPSGSPRTHTKLKELSDIPTGKYTDIVHIISQKTCCGCPSGCPSACDTSVSFPFETCEAGLSSGGPTTYNAAAINPVDGILL